MVIAGNLPRLSRRDVLRFAGATAGMALLSACAPIQSPPEATSAANAGQPRSGGALTIGRLGDPNSLDGHYLGPRNSGTIWPLYDPLITYDLQLQPQPMLAESWEISPDFTQFKFNLRKGVQFHTGRELTSEDVAWNIQRVRDPKVGVGSLVTMSNWFTTIQTPDKSTLLLKSDAPRPAALDFFQFLLMVDPVTMQGPDAQRKAVGTGPFTFVEWAQGDHLSLAKNKNYWMLGRPYLDEITYQILADPQSMVTQLEAGVVDLVDSPILQDTARLQKDSKYAVQLNDWNGEFWLLYCNVTTPPFDNKLVRQALNYAIDRKRFVDSTLAGIGDVRDLPWPPRSLAYDAGKNGSIAFDPQKAKALLQQAGVSNLEFDWLHQATFTELASLGQIVQADLSQLGVKMNIKSLDSNAFIDTTGRRAYNGVAATLSSYTQVHPSSVFVLSRAFFPTANTAGFQSEAYTQLVNQVSTEPDESKRGLLYSRLNDLLLDESFLMPLAPQRLPMVMKANVHGPRRDMAGGVSFTDTWKS